MRILHGLSYERMEYQLLDRTSFKRFAQLEHSARVPDHSTSWNFEQNLGENGAKLLFDEALQQIKPQGFAARQKVYYWQMIDGTIISAPKQHFTKEEKEVISNGEHPKDWREEINMTIYFWTITLAILGLGALTFKNFAHIFRMLYNA